MTAATSALRRERSAPASEILENVIESSNDPGEIATALLEAAVTATPCRGGAVLIETRDADYLEVAASTIQSRYAPGRRLRNPPRLPRDVYRVALRAGGLEFGQIVLLDAGVPDPGARATLRRIALHGTVLHALEEAETLRNRLTETAAIVEVGQALTGLLAMDDVLSYVVYLAESLVQGSCATIALLSPDGSELVLKNSTGSLRSAEGATIPVEGSLMGWVVESGTPVITRNVSDDPRSFHLPSRQGPGLVVPVQMKGGTIGAFLVARLEESPPFTPENLATLQKMSAYAAIAIQNARLYREQTDAAHALREKASELQSAYSELNRQQEQLVVSEKMAALGRVTAGIAHEINSPLGGIRNALLTARGYTEEYRSSIGDPEISDEDHRAIARDIGSALALAEGASEKVAQFVRSIKTETRPGQRRSSRFDPAAEVDATIVLLQHRLSTADVAVLTELDRDLVLTGDPGKFAVVVQNLISNSIDAYEGGRGEIRVRLAAIDDAIRLEVEDHGCGIPEEIRGRIFDYLFTTKEVGKGTGLGLAMVHSVVTSDFDGEIQLDSEIARGTTFRLIIPLNRTEEARDGA